MPPPSSPAPPLPFPPPLTPCLSSTRASPPPPLPRPRSPAPLSEHDLRLVCHLAPSSAAEAQRELNELSERLHGAGAHFGDGGGAGACFDLVVIDAPCPAPRDGGGGTNDGGGMGAGAVTGVASALDYLLEVSPYAVEFMEAHPHVGSYMSKLNAHGNPINDHVGGVCHAFGGSGSVGGGMGVGMGVGTLADVLDVLPPTRLSLTGANLWTGREEESGGSDAEEAGAAGGAGAHAAAEVGAGGGAEAGAEAEEAAARRGAPSERWCV